MRGSDGTVQQLYTTKTYPHFRHNTAVFMHEYTICVSENARAKSALKLNILAGSDQFPASDRCKS